MLHHLPVPSTKDADSKVRGSSPPPRYASAVNNVVGPEALGVVAQVIPVLILIVVIESRRLPKPFLLRPFRRTRPLTLPERWAIALVSTAYLAALAFIEMRSIASLLGVWRLEEADAWWILAPVGLLVVIAMAAITMILWERLRPEAIRKPDWDQPEAGQSDFM